MFRQIFVFTKNQDLPSVKALQDLAMHNDIIFKVLNPLEEGQLTLGRHLQLCKEADLDAPSLLIIRTSGIEFDDFDLLLAEAFQAEGICVNLPISSLRVLRDKDRQLLALRNLGLSIVPTIVARGEPENFRGAIEEMIHTYADDQKLVVKSIRGNKGIGHKLLSLNEFLKEWKSKEDQRYHIQPYLKERREVRMITFHHPEGVKNFFIERISGRDWRRNGDFTEFKQFTPSPTESEEFLEISSQLWKRFKMPCFAVDFIFDKTWLILEVNSSAGFEKAQKTLGLNLYQIYFETLMGLS